MNHTYSLGKRIKAARKKHGLTQNLFAKKMGVSKGAVINYEKDYRAPDAHFLIRMIKLFNISSEWLLMGSGPMDPKYNGPGQLGFPLDDDVLKMMEYFQIPAIKLAVMAEYRRIKKVFEPLILEYDNNKKTKKQTEDNG